MSSSINRKQWKCPKCDMLEPIEFTHCSNCGTSKQQGVI